MKNKKGMVITVCAILISIFTYFVVIQWNKGSVTIEEKITVAKVEGREDVTDIVIEIEEDRKEPIEVEFPSTMNEYEIQNAIHAMSHQKIRAEDKWGFLPLTQKRVKRLIEVVKMNETSYKQSETYLQILNRWANNDFSRVDKDHNAIWDLQNGNVGRATGILNSDEEKEFIKKHFNVEIKK